MLIPILSSFKLIRLTFCTGEILFAPVFKYGKISSRTLHMINFILSSNSQALNLISAIKLPRLSRKRVRTMNMLECSNKKKLAG